MPRKRPRSPNGPRGPKTDKIIRDALMLELASEISIKDEKTGRSKKFRKLRLLVRAIVNAGIKGDVPAAKEIFDRVDGKIVQQVQGPGKDGAIPIDIKNLSNAQIQQLLDRLIAGLPGTGGG